MVYPVRYNILPELEWQYPHCFQFLNLHRSQQVLMELDRISVIVAIPLEVSGCLYRRIIQLQFYRLIVSYCISGCIGVGN